MKFIYQIEKTEGYGPSKEGLKKLIDLNVGLILPLIVEQCHSNQLIMQIISK